MRYALYFILGGTVVSLTTYLSSLGRSWLAAFVSTFPALTMLTFILIYQSSGVDPTVPYAKNLLYFALPWVGYVAFFILTVNHLGFWLALFGSVTFFVCISALSKFVVWS
jgi:hypothetical protein